MPDQESPDGMERRLSRQIADVHRAIAEAEARERWQRARDREIAAFRREMDSLRTALLQEMLLLWILTVLIMVLFGEFLWTP